MKSYSRAQHLRALMLCGAAAVLPISPADAAEPSMLVEEVTVNGQRPIAESEAAALYTQKNSDSLVAVAASDSVGRLPDQNIAQATGRLPGVAVERDQGQARYISLRGAPNYWTTLSFDGINVVSPEGRDARFDTIPSSIASQIVVSKAVTPDMPGETVAGNVNIITRSGLDYDGFHFAGKLGGGTAVRSGRLEHEASAVVSDVFQTGHGTLGALISGSYYQRNMVTDNFEIDWEQVSQDTRPGAATRFWPREFENKLYRLMRRNISGSGRLDWAPNDAHLISLRSLYTIFLDDEARDNYIVDADDRQSDLVPGTAACSTAVNPTPATTGYADICIGNTPLRGTLYGVDINQRSTLRAFRQSVLTNTLEGKHDFGGGWRVNWLGNFTESKDDRSVVGEARWDSPSARTQRPTVAYDFTNPNISTPQFFTTVQLSNPTRFQAGPSVSAIDTFNKPLSSLSPLSAIDTTTAYTAKLVIDKDVELLGGETTFRAGFQFDQRTKTANEKQITLNTPAQFAAVGMPTNYTAFSLDKPFMGKLPMGYNFRYFDTLQMRQVAAAAWANFTPTVNTANNYQVREQVLAGFGMATMKFDWGSIVGGVRVEQLDNRGKAEATIGTTTAPVTADSSHTLVFPSLHINYNVDDSKKLRLSFNSGAARADYDQLRPNVVVNDSNQTISGGNPAVKPERAYGVDAYFEWYVQPQGYLMAGLFYKEVKDVLYTQRRTFGSDALNSGGIDRSGYTFSGITNGGTGRIYGMEMAAQMQLEPWTEDLGLPDWMGGFGISANLTLNDSKVNKPAVSGIPARKIRLPGTSDMVYNIGGYYEKYGVSIRAQYQRRSTWMDGVADTLADAGDTYWAADDELDLSARAALTDNLEVYLDASNVLNQPGRRYSEPGNLLSATGIPTPRIDSYTIEWERFGPRYGAGIRVTF
jgi:TonB-dependent receptor